VRISGSKKSPRRSRVKFFWNGIGPEKTRVLNRRS
jgi:hypothetical protein